MQVVTRFFEGWKYDNMAIERRSVLEIRVMCRGEPQTNDCVKTLEELVANSAEKVARLTAEFAQCTGARQTGC